MKNASSALVLVAASLLVSLPALHADGSWVMILLSISDSEQR